MKKIIIIIVLVGFALAAFADSFTMAKEDKILFSQIDKEHIEDFEPDGWVILVKQIGDNKVEASFPVEPVLSYQKDPEVFSYHAKEDQVDFFLNIQKDTWDLSDHVAKIEGLSSFFHGKSTLGPYVDLEYGNVKERIYFAEGKAFQFQTKNAKPAQHQEFISSFGVIHPLK